MGDPTFRLLSFKIYNEKHGNTKGVDNKTFIIQMFGIDEAGKSYSIKVKGFQPFFYVKVGSNWGISMKKCFLKQVNYALRREELGKKYDDYRKGRRQYISPKLDDADMTKEEYVRSNKETYKSYYEKSILDCKIIKRHKLYGFDGRKEHRFILMKFKNTSAMYKIKNFWYDHIKDRESLFGRKDIIKSWRVLGVDTWLYEAKLPPLLRYFHIKEISPSGWIKIPRNKIIRSQEAETNCDFEYTIHSRYIIPLAHKETGVPVKVCSFDIEAGSSHGDFPMPQKSYRKWVSDVINYWAANRNDIRKMLRSAQENLLINMLYTAFGYANIAGIHPIYPKWDMKNISKEKLRKRFDPFIKEDLFKIIVEDWNGKRRVKKKNSKKNNFHNDDDDEDEDFNDIIEYKNFIKRRMKFIDYLNDDKMDKLRKLEVLAEALEYIPNCRYNLVPIKGDPVTFIGSTFMRIGEELPYFNHGVCFGECGDVVMENSRCEIESYENERDVLTAWVDMLQREKPDVIIGYNIFGFDWKFLCARAEELGCWEEFCQLSRNKKARCMKREKSIRIASGIHNLIYMEMDGIIQIDLYNYFRRAVNLASYKLQDVGSHFIGDMVQNYEYINGKTRVYSNNLMGLQKYNFICFELIGHSSDSYKNGKKFKVVDMNKEGGWFDIEECIEGEKGKKLRWGLGKDDISPADLFKAFSDTGTKEDKTEIARYCFQDCNLVHHLFRKNDIWTGMVEQAAICSIPIDFVVMRGQGIKLLSFVGKKCREKRTLMPVVEKVENDGSYEGAICLKPKRGFYDDKNPVAVVDYSSLYPSCMISENISHDSKVWTKEYNLEGSLLRSTGERDLSGNFIYDHLEGYEYVDIEYDRYEWISPDGKKKEVKVKVGTKTCRFAQFQDNKKAIMPAILQGLLAARKATRVKSKYQTLTLKDGTSAIGLLSEKGDKYIVTDVRLENEQLVKTHQTIEMLNVEKIEDTYNNFMKNVFNQRQQSIKVVANSLYGQCGARTSSFYEKDIAASTTATGRKLLLYARRVIEEVYGDCYCDTKYGKVKCNAAYIYGDTDSVFFTFHLKELDGTPIRGKKGLEITIELALEAGALASKFLKPPHDLEYEKTFLPFLLLSKKRYVGLLYERNPDKCKRKSMGIVLKRRDNAPIVKDCYGGIIDILMKEHDTGKAVTFVKSFLQDMVDEKFSLEKLIISKSLRDFYKNPQSIAHRVLADRIGQRDPGNKPAVGSRIPYAYIQTKRKVKLQGDRIEHPDYIRQHKLRPDYAFYITNQIMKPVTQIFSLLLEKMPSFKFQLSGFQRRLRSMKRKWKNDDEKFDKEEIKVRNKFVKQLLFDSVIRQANNTKTGQRTIESFFAS